MPDASLPPPPRDWPDAFAALPLESPPADGWRRLSARLDARPRHRLPWWLAAAAALGLAVLLPWQMRTVPGTAVPAGQDATGVASATQDPLQPLYAESQQLESLLRLTRDDRVASATAAALAGDFDARIADIDAALMQPGLAPAQQRRLWEARVDTLRAAAGFASTRRWLAAHGDRYDARLVQVD
ncbi:hypothetical protein [Luteimonas vadosa]|uniref:DUF3379 domain-containing protein n=1 Tax=Luteimonas vadosa TaxID=1165507 RepID=A0ABP9DXM5_9GAMM